LNQFNAVVKTKITRVLFVGRIVPVFVNAEASESDAVIVGIGKGCGRGGNRLHLFVKIIIHVGIDIIDIAAHSLLSSKKSRPTDSMATLSCYINRLEVQSSLNGAVSQRL